MAAKKKSERQVRFLLSDDSPLDADQKTKLKGELHSGAVKIKRSRQERAGKKLREARAGKGT